MDKTITKRSSGQLFYGLFIIISRNRNYFLYFCIMNESGFPRKIKRFILFSIFLTPCLIAVGGTARPDGFDTLAKLSPRELYTLGEDAYQSEDYDKALQIFMVICSRYNLSDHEENQRTYTKAFIRNGNLRYKTATYSSAMDFYLKALHIAETHGFDDLIGLIYAHIGNIYASNNDFESAITAYKRALPYAYAFGKDNVKSMALNNLVGTHYFKGEIDSAEHYFRLFQELHYDDPRFIYDICLNQALIFNGIGKNDSAKIYAKKAAGNAIENHLSQPCIGACYSSIAQFFEEEGQWDSALFYLHLNEDIARETQTNELLVATLRDLGRIYDNKGLREEALAYKSEYWIIYDSIFGQKEFNDLKNKQIFYELERNASTINNLNAIRMLQRNGIVVLSVAIGIFIALIAILYYQKRKLKAAYGDLFERNHRQLSDEINYRHRIQTLEKSLENARIKISALAALATANHGAENETDKKDMGETETDGKDGSVEENASTNRKTVVNQEQRNKIAHDIMRIMETTEDWCACDYSIDKLAAVIDSNARYVSEVINDVFDKNFRAMLNEYRIKKAMIRLSDIEHYGHLTIKAISESVGYKSQATFITAFTKFTGLKPGLYQKLAVERHAKGERMDTALIDNETEI